MAGVLDDMLSDFIGGEYLIKNSACLGKKYVFRKKSSEAIQLSELERVYEYIHRTNLIMDTHNIVGIIGKKQVILCKLPNRSMDDEVKKILTAVYLRNPKATPHNDRLTALHAICLHIFRHLAQKSLDIRQYACEISVQSAEKSDCASCAQSLCGIALM